MSNAGVNHERFLDNLDHSEIARWTMAHWLTTHGHVVRVPPLRKAPKQADWREYVDQGDLEISLRVEVKKISRNFTCRRDWPFREFIVCAKHSFDLAFPKPYGYIILNPGMTHAAMVRASGCNRWTVSRKTDSRYSQVRQDDVIFDTRLSPGITQSWYSEPWCMRSGKIRC